LSVRRPSIRLQPTRLPMRLRTLLLGAAAAVAAFVGALFIGEALWVGVFASDAQVAEYRFGSEPMVGYGGPAYESASRYVLTGFFLGMVLVAGAVVLLFAAFHARRRSNVQPRTARPHGQRDAAGSGPRG
jgi:hypothetical protein